MKPNCDLFTTEGPEETYFDDVFECPSINSVKIYIVVDPGYMDREPVIVPEIYFNLNYQ